MASETPHRLTLEVIGASLLAIAEEMGSALIRSSYSTNIKERQDCSTAIFDAGGEVIAQAEHIPMHLGSLLGVVREILQRYPVSALAPGDVFISNDPYTGGGTHLPDINLVSPVFANGALFGFVANIAHHADRTSDSIQTVWDEGLRITPIRLVEAGEIRDDLMELLLANYSLPRERLGDIRAQLAANKLGERRILELIDRYEVDTVRAAYEASLAYGDRKIRSAIAELPDGVYAFRDAMDGDGVTAGHIPIAVEITKRGDQLVLDFSETGPQCAGDINVVYFALLATVYYALKAALDPTVPANSGFYRAITVVAPEGTIVNAEAPAPVGWRTHTCQRIADVVLGALAQVLPEHIPAAGNGANCALVFTGEHPVSRESYIYLETLAGGAGATSAADGMDAVQVHVTNTSNLPVEALETAYPLLVSEYSLVTDSGGSGRHRGGMGLRRSIEILNHDARLLATTERALIAPWGLFGGGSGGRARVSVTTADGGATALPPKVWGYKLRPGDRVTIDTPGAGGYGPVSERSPELLRQDERDGVVLARTESEEVGGAP